MLTISEIFGLVIAFLLVVILGLGVAVYVEHEKVLAAQADTAACGVANQEWQDKAKENNDRLQRIEQENESLTAKAKAALQAAQSGMDKNLALSKQLKGVKASPTDCSAAQSLINQYLGAKP